jgi:putative hemolysin
MLQAGCRLLSQQSVLIVNSLATPARPDRRLTLVDGEFLSQQEVQEGRYIVRYARTSEEVDAVSKLRFEVFNIELGQGLAASYRNGREWNDFDLDSHHLVIIDRPQRRIIGTCGLRSYEIAKTIEGFYSSRQFDLSSMPIEVLTKAIEVGRVCIARAHRNWEVHMILLRSLKFYLNQSAKRYLFSSLPVSTQDPLEAGKLFCQLNREGQLHTGLRVPPKVGFKCLWYRSAEAQQTKIALATWFRILLQFGGKLCGPPAMNRQHRTIDSPVLLDLGSHHYFELADGNRR